MKRKLFVLVLALLALCVSAAYGGHHVREEASRRNIKLISVEEAQSIAAKRLKSQNVRFTETELDDEADDYPNAINFRPVYQIECKCEGWEYDIDVDAVTGKILKFKRDD